MLLVVLFAVLAALPRLSGLDVPLTTDERVWFQRTTNFAAGLVDGEWSETYRTGDPA